MHDYEPACYAGREMVAILTMGQDIVSFVSLRNLILVKLVRVL